MDDALDGLFERDDVVYEKTTETLDVEAFERARRRAERIEGGVVVAVTDAAGRVLLVENDWMDGYGFPGGGVEPGEVWETTAAREVEEETGVAVTIDRPWRVHRQVLEHDDERLDGHVVFCQASPDGDTMVAAASGTAAEDIQAAGWFAAVPDGTVRPDLICDALTDP